MTNEIAVKIANHGLADRTYWLSVYTACQLHELSGSPSFDEFYQDPWLHLEQAGQSEAPASMDDGYEPLLPAQAAIALRLDDSPCAWTTMTSSERTSSARDKASTRHSRRHSPSRPTRRRPPAKGSPA